MAFNKYVNREIGVFGLKYILHKAASINHVDKRGGRGVPEKTMFVHIGGREG